VTAPTILSVVGVSIDGMDNTLVDPADPSDDLHEAAPVAGIDETDPVEIIEGDPDQVGEVAPDDAEPLPADAIAERLQGTDVVIDDLPTPGA
jgi:hypothetical protein